MQDTKRLHPFIGHSEKAKLTWIEVRSEVAENRKREGADYKGAPGNFLR